MYVSDLSLDDFRSYEHLVLCLKPGVSAFVGANGQGKTNLVEAIGYLATLSSHRAGADTALVRQAMPGEPQPQAAVVRARVVHGERPSTVELEIVAGRANRARLNRNATRPRELLGVVRAVTFAPEDLALVREEPSKRRRFLDDLVVTVRPTLAGVRAEHEKILAQRASLLKSMRAARRGGRGGSSWEAMATTLEVWDAQLAAASAQLMTARVEMLRRLRPWIVQAYATVSDSASPVHVAYRSSLAIHEGAPEPDPRLAGPVLPDGADSEASWLAAEASLTDVPAVAARLEAAMASVRDREIDCGANLIGAHRDDIILTLGGLAAKGFASHGEQWSLALALRLASYEMLRHDVDAYGGDGEPILILDDVFASLDGSRRRALSEIVAGAGQALLTAAAPTDVPAELVGERFTVSSSGVTHE